MGIWNWHREDEEDNEIVYVVEYGLHYETYMGGVYRNKRDAQKEVRELEKEEHLNYACVVERELE